MDWNGSRHPARACVYLTCVRVVEDPFFFHQTRHEIESSFVVLNAILAFLIAALQIVTKISEPEIGENSFENVRRGLVLKDAAVAGFRKQPEPRMNLREVTREAKVCLFLNETPNDAIEIMLYVVSKVERYRHGFADNGLKVDGVIFRNHLECELKQAGDLLFTTEPTQQELVWSQGVETCSLDCPERKQRSCRF